MRDVFVLGVGQTPVSEQTDSNIRDLGTAAVREALKDAGLIEVDALYVGSMFSALFSRQQLLAALIAQGAGLAGVEALTVEAACASGAGAVRMGCLAIQAGVHDVIVACGAEHMTLLDKESTKSALANATDWNMEGRNGENILSLNARLMTLYMEKYGVTSSAFCPFALNAHDNSVTNANAVFRHQIREADYYNSPVIAGPLRRLDAAPVCDGAAAIVLGSERVKSRHAPTVRIRASTVGTDVAALGSRQDPLRLEAAISSCERAYRQSGLSHTDIDLFEAHDAFTILTILSLEAAGFSEAGHGFEPGQTGAIRLDGQIPISTMGGLKARGHPVGASGVYQIVDAYHQLMDRAAENQVEGARIAMTQSFGGLAITAITHILERT